jgi:hypothetical protein
MDDMQCTLRRSAQLILDAARLHQKRSLEYERMEIRTSIQKAHDAKVFEAYLVVHLIIRKYACIYIYMNIHTNIVEICVFLCFKMT